MGVMRTKADPAEIRTWTEAEVEHYLRGPFDGGIPGLVRRIRRILDVSQRGLAAMLGISQSQVARWETSRTSPRAAMLAKLLRLARVRVSLHDQETGKEVEPMRDDGARDRALRRYPAHVDLQVTGWWSPRESKFTGQDGWWRVRSRRERLPFVRYHHQWWKHTWRKVRGTPVDHPARHQLVAEAFHLDEVREERRRRVMATYARPPQPPPSALGGVSA